MTVRVCLGPSDGERCPRGALTRGTRCPDCARVKEKARGTRQERGYDAQHDATRAQWAPLVATGHVKCWRCRLPIAADGPWDLGHDDHDRNIYRGPEHVGRECPKGGNRATSGRYPSSG